jgi:hypothetical protein
MAGAAQLNSSLLTLSVIGVLLPAAFHIAVQPTDGVDPLTKAQEGHDILAISHGVCNFSHPYCPNPLTPIRLGCDYLAFQ